MRRRFQVVWEVASAIVHFNNHKSATRRASHRYSPFLMGVVISVFVDHLA